MLTNNLPSLRLGLSETHQIIMVFIASILFLQSSSKKLFMFELKFFIGINTSSLLKLVPQVFFGSSFFISCTIFLFSVAFMSSGLLSLLSFSRLESVIAFQITFIEIFFHGSILIFLSLVSFQFIRIFSILILPFRSLNKRSRSYQFFDKFLKK